jgi:hypothetical protein
MVDSMSWAFSNVWNESLELGRPERALKPRDNMWAGEIGGSYIDRYLKMTGVEPTNPPNARSKRKFEAGNLMEWVVKLVLWRAGILIKSQEWLSYQYEGLLEVTGKLDFLAGGKPDYNKAKILIDELNLPEFFGRATKKIVEYLSSKYPEGLKEIVLECKSCSSYMYEHYEQEGADPRHKAQLFHYLKSKGLDEGHILYVCKDDLRLLEFHVMNPSEVEDYYKKDIEVMTKYVKEGVQPPLEEMVLFNKFKFATNFKVAYSNYIKLLYGYDSQFAYDEAWKDEVAKWNRVYKRCVDGDKMTPKNLEVIERIKYLYPNFEELVILGKNNKDKVDIKSEEE